MANGRSTSFIVLSLILIAVGVGGYWLWRRQSTPPLIGVVHATEVRVAPEIGGSLVEVKVHKGDSVHAGDVVAKLSAVELTASVEQARAALVKATADRNNVYAGTVSVANRLIRANVNVGIANFPDDHLYPKELMILADQRMQQDRMLRRPPAA